MAGGVIGQFIVAVRRFLPGKSVSDDIAENLMNVMINTNAFFPTHICIGRSKCNYKSKTESHNTEFFLC